VNARFDREAGSILRRGIRDAGFGVMRDLAGMRDLVERGDWIGREGGLVGCGIGREAGLVGCGIGRDAGLVGKREW